MKSGRDQRLQKKKSANSTPTPFIGGKRPCVPFLYLVNQCLPFEGQDCLVVSHGPGLPIVHWGSLPLGTRGGHHVRLGLLPGNAETCQLLDHRARCCNAMDTIHPSQQRERGSHSVQQQRNGQRAHAESRQDDGITHPPRQSWTAASCLS